MRQSTSVASINSCAREGTRVPSAMVLVAHCCAIGRSG